MNISTIFKDIQSGKPIIVIDSKDREWEGDLVIAAEQATEKNLAFIIRNARGLMCLPTCGKILDRLEIPMMVKESTCKLQTPFTVTIDAAEGIHTGMSVQDRLKTISVLLDDKSIPTQLARPGHLMPLRPQERLLLQRQGHTEASIELMKLAGMKPVSIIVEIINNDGTMAKSFQLERFAQKYSLSIISIEELFEEVYGGT